jgi:hypothetical protein
MENRTVLAVAACVAVAACGNGTGTGAPEIGLIGPAVKAPWRLPPRPGVLDSGIVVFDDHPTPLPPDTNQPPPTDNGTHSGINSKPAALRLVESFLLSPQRAIDGCRIGGSPPAPCDCATGACD